MKTTPETGVGARTAFVHSLGLLAVFAGEWVLFRLGAARHYAWIYPRWFDQQQYLSQAYDAYDVMRAHGFAAGARHALAAIVPQGSLHGFLALAAFVLLGPSRLSALSVNLAAFLGLQAFMFAAVRRVSGSWSLSWAAIALLAVLQAPWANMSGSAFDFRLDWMAACAYGAALCAALSGDGFRSTRWAVLFGVTVGVAVLVRHLTAVYFCAIYPCLLVWLLCQPGRGGRCGRLALSGFVAVAMSGWAFWRNRHSISTYYWTGQFAGPERALRSSHLDLMSSIGWVSSELMLRQVGEAFLVLALGAAAVLGACALVARIPGPGVPTKTLRESWVVALVFFLVPATVLVLHPEKSPDPLEIVLAPAVGMFVLLLVQLSRPVRPGARIAVCAAVALAGAVVFARDQSTDPFSPQLERQFREVNALGDFILFRSEEAGLTRPRISVTGVLDGLNAGAFGMLGRERQERLVHFTAILPTGLFRAEPGAVMDRLADSDFVCLVTRAQKWWPFDGQMAEMQPQMQRWCDAHLRRDGDMDTAEFSASIYERPDLSGPWAGRGVDLPAMLAASHEGPANAPARVPGAPRLVDHGPVLWTTKAELRYEVKAAYSPLRFQAEGLPEGFSIDPETGEIRGLFARAGTFTATIHASNALGSTEAKLTFHVTDEAWAASIRAPEKARVGLPVRIPFSAFDTGGTLNFIDVTDLTVPRVLGRLAANEDELRIWEGAYSATFREPGGHLVQLRFVRLDPAGSGGYAFVDRECRIQVDP